MNKLSLSLLLAGVGLIIALTSFANGEKTKSAQKEVFPSKIEAFIKTNIPDGEIVKYEHEGDKMKVKCNDHTELCFSMLFSTFFKFNFKHPRRVTRLVYIRSPLGRELWC